MINEEDHLRIQGLLPGLQPEKTAEMVFALDDALGADDNYAFDAQFGFLTSCPTNVGTGMRASTMLHLPALATVGKLSALLQAISKLGLTVRGIYGEGSEAQGNLYQLSNQVTLGRSEEDTLKTLTAATTQIISYERGARKALQHDSTLLEDRLMRSYGELANARILPAKEFMGRCSDLRLAASLGYVDRDYAFIDALMMDAQDGSLSVRLGGERNERERNMARADYVRAEANGMRQDMAMFSDYRTRTARFLSGRAKEAAQMGAPIMWAHRHLLLGILTDPGSAAGALEGLRWTRRARK